MVSNINKKLSIDSKGLKTPKTCHLKVQIFVRELEEEIFKLSADKCRYSNTSRRLRGSH